MPYPTAVLPPSVRSDLLEQAQNTYRADTNMPSPRMQARLGGESDRMGGRQRWNRLDRPHP